MDWTQLGIAGAALFVLFTLGKVIIKAWTEGDAARTKAMGDGFRSITDSHAAMVRDNRDGYTATTALIHEHHTNVTGQIGNLRDIVIAIDSKVSNMWDLTPVKFPKPATTIAIDPSVFDQSQTQPIPAQPAPLASTVALTPPQGSRATTQGEANRPGPTQQSKAVPREVQGEYSTSTKKPR